MEIETESGCQGSNSSIDKEQTKGTYLVWKDLTVALSKFRDGHSKKLIEGVHGFAEPGKLMAIMGPSGSGKSTLLDALAGRLSRNVIMSGDVLFNGKKGRPSSTVAYVTQEDVLLGTLTVRETLTFSANLRLPATMEQDEVKEVVETTITDLGLRDCADGMVGNWHLRGISGGEKKRLSIGLEVLTSPSILFLDEPTSGLDSASAFFVVDILRNIARDGKTIISSIHQPSSEVFAQFDSLFLLSNGVTVYFGEAKNALEFFAAAGFPCPSRRNPSDHFLRCINTDFDNVQASLKGYQRFQLSSSSSDPFSNMSIEEIKKALVERYRQSTYAKDTKARVKELMAMKLEDMVTTNGRRASRWKHLKTLTKRSMINMSRDIAYYWSRIMVYIFLSICVGSIYFDVGYGYTSILARVTSGGFITGFMAFLSIGGFPSFVEEIKVFHREMLNGYYGITVYILSNYISSFPFLLAISVISGTICFYMVKFRSGFSYYAFFCLNLLGCISVVESMMMVVAALVPNYLIGLLTGAGIIGIMLLTSGFFRLIPDLPKIFWRYPISYINFGAWGLQGAYKNNFLGLEFEPLQAGDFKLHGEIVISSMFGIRASYSKWWDLAAIFLILLCNRILFFIVLKFKERAMPIVKDFFSKRALNRLQKRPSFAKIPSLASSRHPPRYPLAAQEGFRSPTG